VHIHTVEIVTEFTEHCDQEVDAVLVGVHVARVPLNVMISPLKTNVADSTSGPKEVRVAI
jgi:hypothetical protein